MKVLLLLNGPDGHQTGIEDGFSNLRRCGLVDELEWIYFAGLFNKQGAKSAEETILEAARRIQPSLIVIFHVGHFNFSEPFLIALRDLASRPTLAYDEGDMYGSWAKPITGNMKVIMRHVDVVSLRGLGAIHEQVSKLNSRVIYTPHHADVARFDTAEPIPRQREKGISFIGNNFKGALSSIRRLPGGRQREAFVKMLGAAFPQDLALYGAGWEGYPGNQGPLDFFRQLEACRRSWVSVGYDHYPDIPYYFSNRLPIGLMAGTLHVCHYHEGYENVFKNCDFIFFFKKNSEAVDIINFIFSLSTEDLLERAQRARDFSIANYHPNVIWRRFFENVLESRTMDSVRAGKMDGR